MAFPNILYCKCKKCNEYCEPAMKDKKGRAICQTCKDKRTY